VRRWNRKSFREYLSAIRRFPWLNEIDGAFETLLYSDCRTDEERKMIFNLLPNFLYLSGDQFSGSLRRLAEGIVEDQRYNDATCQIVAMTIGSEVDSGEFVLYSLKRHFQRLGWTQHKLVNRCDRAYRTYRDSPVHKNIILVDEFVGTGRTVVGRIELIERVFNENGITNFSVRARALVALESGIDAARESGYEVLAEHVLPKGISDCFPSDTARKMVGLMLEIESRLALECNGHELPSLGYQESEALYARTDGNTPNNVFPVFWWPYYPECRSRKTVLTRALMAG